MLEPEENKYYSVHQAAEFLGVSANTLRTWDREGHFKSTMATQGKHRRYSGKDIKDRLEKMKNRSKILT